MNKFTIDGAVSSAPIQSTHIISSVVCAPLNLVGQTKTARHKAEGLVGDEQYEINTSRARLFQDRRGRASLIKHSAPKNELLERGFGYKKIANDEVPKKSCKTSNEIFYPDNELHHQWSGWVGENQSRKSAEEKLNNHDVGIKFQPDDFSKSADRRLITKLYTCLNQLFEGAERGAKIPYVTTLERGQPITGGLFSDLPIENTTNDEGLQKLEIPVGADFQPTNYRPRAITGDREPLSIDLPLIRKRSGHICKPTALANVDNYWANLLGVPNIPLRKNHRGVYENENNSYADGLKITTSVRQLAKNNRSIQGEILDINDFKLISKKMGYMVQHVMPESSWSFGKIISEKLSRKVPIIAFFDVDTTELIGFPSRVYREREHACVITEIDATSASVSIAHWGSLYQGVPIELLYESMCCLPKTRGQEIYKKSIFYPADPCAYKYEIIMGAAEVDKKNESLYKTSIRPLSDSGFRNSLIVLMPDMDHERWSK